MEDRYSYILGHLISKDPLQLPGEICKSGKSQHSCKALIKREHHGDVLSGPIYFGKMYLRSLVENILLQVALAMPEILLHILSQGKKGL